MKQNQQQKKNEIDEKMIWDNKNKLFNWKMEFLIGNYKDWKKMSIRKKANQTSMESIWFPITLFLSP